MPVAAGTALPVVFVGPYEHHSNDLIWREFAVTLVRIPLDGAGRLCMETLAQELVRHAEAPLKIGSFSAASNVTGVRTDMRALGALLHRHGALFFADYAAAGPYLPIAMSESAPGAADHIDAIFLSPHKFVGGPGASGVLVADRALLDCAVPSVPGGGTVAYVNAGMHRYVSDAERREEAGTPAIIGDIRAGMVMQLKSDIGAHQIEAAESAVIAKVFRRLGERAQYRNSGAGGRQSAGDLFAQYPAPGALICTPISWWRCSTTCSASRRAAAVPAPGPMGTICSASPTPRRPATMRC